MPNTFIKAINKGGFYRKSIYSQEVSTKHIFPYSKWKNKSVALFKETYFMALGGKHSTVFKTKAVTKASSPGSVNCDNIL